MLVENVEYCKAGSNFYMQQIKNLFKTLKILLS